MEDFELMLFDRINTIKEMNKKYDLEKNAYISFSGGRDSTVLHHLIDMALPNNKIPRIYMNTGIEYLAITYFVKEMQKEDNRIIMISPKKHIKKVLEEKGYPFKSKEFSQLVDRFQRLGKTKSVNAFLNLNGKLACPTKLKYMFTEENKLKISDACCKEMKEKPLDEYANKNGKTISIIGITGGDKGRRNAFGNNGCVKKYYNQTKIYPLRVIDESFEEWFIKKYNIKLCKLYYPPYNFKRTGCKGCPFDVNLEKDLETMKMFFKNEAKQCEIIWKPVYDEYRKVKYRLKKGEEITIFDFMEEQE